MSRQRIHYSLDVEGYTFSNKKILKSVEGSYSRIFGQKNKAFRAVYALNGKVDKGTILYVRKYKIIKGNFFHGDVWEFEVS